MDNLAAMISGTLIALAILLLVPVVSRIPAIARLIERWGV